ncbi:dehydrogenase, partial [Streptomyces sp. NPDC127190]
MTTFALVGAGLGLATDRRFGTAGHPLALTSLSAGKLDGLTAELAGDGIFTATSSTSSPWTRPCTRRQPPLGSIEILQYSLVPRADFTKPVGRTSSPNNQPPH